MNWNFLNDSLSTLLILVPTKKRGSPLHLLMKGFFHNYYVNPYEKCFDKSRLLQNQRKNIILIKQITVVFSFFFMMSIFLLLEGIISLRIMLAWYILKITTVGPSSSVFNLQEWQLADALGKGVKQILGDISYYQLLN